MDNGLIFPYPRRNAHDDPGHANHPNPPRTSVRGRARVGPGPVVVERWGDAGR
jgi:hypothetical protein